MKTNDESKILFPDYTILKPAHEALLAVHFFRSEKKIMGNIIKYGEISWYYIVDWSSFTDDTNRKLKLEQSDSITIQ